MTAEEFWQQFQIETGQDLFKQRYDAWQFGDSPDKLLQLVLAGTKQATASLHAVYEKEDEPLPDNNTYSIILDSQNEPQCIIKNTAVLIRPFKDFDEAFAYTEGEGDRSLAYWRKVHIEFFNEEAKRYDVSFNEESLVVGEIFKVVYRK